MSARAATNIFSTDNLICRLTPAVRALARIARGVYPVLTVVTPDRLQALADNNHPAFKTISQTSSTVTLPANSTFESCCSILETAITSDTTGVLDPDGHLIIIAATRCELLERLAALGFSAHFSDKVDGNTQKETAASGQTDNAIPVFQRLARKVAVVTGSAQGFGRGIAEELCRAGAQVVIADLNAELARDVSSNLNKIHGAAATLPVAVNVTDESSMDNLIATTVLMFGGLDLFVSNAGVLKAGGLEELSLDDFHFVTDVNYTGYFIGVKYASRPMKIQARFATNDWFDIVQINSKSGLEGSNRNFAYAGGKFGSIGLTQSFAKELVSSRIKVNAVCPGNYYEGPLWSDPDHGLFVQYLNTGKVPGAQSVEDVYQHYINQVPMRKGCSPRDVARAIFYAVEQENETGQALPVTGGQVMLS